jgi:hypothetical protein
LARRPDVPIWLLALGAAALASLAAGALFVRYPFLLIVPPALVIGVLLVSSPTFRLLFIVVGGMLVLQSSQSLDASKLAYLAGVSIAAPAAFLKRDASQSAQYKQLEPLLAVSTVTAVFLLLSGVLAHFHGIAFKPWLRDVSSYLLFAAVPFFVLDSARDKGTKRLLLPLFVIVGILSALSFLVEWEGRRNLISLPLDRILLPSSAPAVALFCYSAARSLHDRTFSIRWESLTLLIPTLMLLTATRSAILILAGLLVVVLMNQQLVSRSLGRLATLAFAAFVLAALTPALLGSTFDFTGVTSRFGTISTLVKQPSSDLSFLARKQETEQAWATFRRNLLLGAGPGVLFRWSLPSELVRNADFEQTNIDTGLSYLAKFGLAGLTVAAAWAIALRRTWRRLPVSARGRPFKTAFLGLVATLAIYLPLANPLEDKGVAFSFLLILALMVTADEAEDQVEPVVKRTNT